MTDSAPLAPLEKVVSNLRLLGGRLCLDFANTVEYRGTDRALDFLPVYRLLVLWSVHAGVLTQADAGPLLSQAESPAAQAALAQAVSLREVIHRVFVACAHKQEIPADTLGAFNAMLSEGLAHRQVAPSGGGYGWVWQPQGSTAGLIWPIALSAAELLTSGDLGRLRQCPGCGWLFFDTSRNGQRTWCDMRICGNRAKAKRHYWRQQSQ